MPKTSSNSQSKEAEALKVNLNITKGFLDLVKKLHSLPDMKKTPFDQTRSLYQAVSKGRDVSDMEKELEEFFGEPAKPAGKPMPLMLRFNPSIKYLDGIRDEQPLFIKKVKAGFYYGALWPWQRDPQSITVHLGFCSHKMSDKDFKKLGDLVKSKILNERVYEEFDSKIGAQVHGISLGSFLQMAAMEKITCTLKIQSKGNVGYLYLLKGDLIDAETGRLTAKTAACNIASWGNAVIDIEKPSKKKENKINRPVVQILTEALKIQAKEAQRKKKPETPIKDQNGNDIIDLQEEILLTDVVAEPTVAKPTKKRLLMLAALAVVVALGTVVSLRLVKSMRIKNEYQNLLLTLENQQELNQQVMLLNRFVNSHPQSEYAKNAEEKIKEVRIRMEELDFTTAMSNADKLLMSKDYEKAAEVYREYLKNYPQSIHAGTIKQKTAGISQHIDEGDYVAFVTSAGGDSVERISSYFKYVEKHPSGKHRGEVNQLIANMAGDYYLFFKKQAAICGAQEDWEQCIQLCDRFINIYPGHKQAHEIKSFRALSLKKRQEKKTLADLMLKAQRAGDDYKTAKKPYIDYLDSHPDSPLKNKIIKELTKLKEQEEQARLLKETEKIVTSLQESKGRFVANSNGTITDKKTGLMWALLDSLLELKKCLNHASAEKYVKNLRTGGYTDWRLPTEDELKGIYKTKPFFPQRAAEWYWTSKSYSRYSDGWQKMVYIVTTNRETEWEKKQAQAQECGAVHAARP